MKKILHFIAVVVLFTWPSKAQKSSPLANLLWEEVGGRIDVPDDRLAFILLLQKRIV